LLTCRFYDVILIETHGNISDFLIYLMVRLKVIKIIKIYTYAKLYIVTYSEINVLKCPDNLS